MKAVIAAIAALSAFVAMTIPASAQDYRTLTDIARELYRACVQTASKQGVPSAEEQCACVSGYLGGVMSDRDFDIASRLTKIGAMAEAGASQAEVQAELDKFVTAGYTEADVNRVVQTLQNHTPRGDAICSGITRLDSV